MTLIHFSSRTGCVCQVYRVAKAKSCPSIQTHPTTRPFLLKIACLWEKISVVILLNRQRRWGFFLFVYFLLLLLLPFQLFPVLSKSSPPPPPSFFTVPLSLPFLCGSATGVFIYSCVPALCVSDKWWESTVAHSCHVSQIRCHNRKRVHIHGCSTLTRTHDLLPLQAKWRPSRHRYTDTNPLWVKGTAAASCSDLTRHPFCRTFRSCVISVMNQRHISTIVCVADVS